MQYLINTTKELVEAYAKAVEGDILCIVISDRNDFQFYIEETASNDWSGCCC